MMTVLHGMGVNVPDEQQTVIFHDFIVMHYPVAKVREVASRADADERA